MTRLRSRLLARAVAFVFLFLPPALATSPNHCQQAPSSPQAATEYFVSLADAARHIAHVAIVLRHGDGTRTLDMPIWNALYQVRNFAINLMNVRAQDASGGPAQVRNAKPSEWEITVPPGCVTVSYDIYLDSRGPFGSQLTADYGFLNWAMVLMYSPELRSKPVSLHLSDTPATWAVRDLHVLGGAAPGKGNQVAGIAPNYDELADSPVEMGALQESSFHQDGATYHIVVDATPSDYDMSQLDKTLEKITHAAVDWMQDRPYEDYTFLYHFPRSPGSGGMEHAYGTAIEVSAERLRASLMPVADVSAHEFFHVWNVKRIRPQSLEPIDYQHEQDTRVLWFSEGVTSTVGDMLLVRAGLADEPMYLQRLSQQITELETRPAHVWQSAEESGLDAWFEGSSFYRSPQRSISYYNKGEILGVLLDLRIRELTGGRKSLRDLFQWVNEHYAKQHRFFEGSMAVQQAAETVTGQSFAEFFREYVAGVEELPYDTFFQIVGLHVVDKTVQIADSGFTTSTNLGGQPEVLQVEPNSAAQRAGLVIGDRVVEINGHPADRFLDTELSQMPPGATVHFKVEDRRGVRKVSLKLGAREEQIYELQDLPQVTAEQRAHRAAWIRGDDESGGAH